MTSIEQKEIRGLSVKTLLTIIVCTVTMVSTTLGTYFSIQSSIREIRLEKQGDDKYLDLRLRTIEIRQSALELQLKELQTREESRQPTSSLTPK